MTDLESRLRAARSSLPAAPPVSAAVRRAALEGVGPRGRSRARSASSWRRRRRVGGALAFAAALTAAGLAAAGVNPCAVAPGAGRSVDLAGGSVVASVRDGTQQVLVAPGRGSEYGRICITLANAQGPDDVSPLMCRAPEAADDPGFNYAERRPGEAAWAFHVRVPDPAMPSSAIVTEYEIPARGGTVTIDSGGREVTLTFPDTTALDRRADQEARDYRRALLGAARAQLAEPEAQRRLSELPVDVREALRLRIDEELGYAQIAERTGVSVAEARTRVSRGLRGAGVDMDGMLP